MSSISQNISKKKRVIACLFHHCKCVGNLEFDTDLVREISREIGFKNTYDATKIDQSENYPKKLEMPVIALQAWEKDTIDLLKGWMFGTINLKPLQRMK